MNTRSILVVFSIWSVKQCCQAQVVEQPPYNFSISVEPLDPAAHQVSNSDNVHRDTLSAETISKHVISIEGDEFMIDGIPLKIISGSCHYFRMPVEYWRDRLRKLKRAGLNAVSTYVEWSYHEPEERQYNFEGDRDVAQFVRIAAEEGLHVLLRPGPYICAERDLGGLPYWLLGKYPNIKLRTTDKDFISESEIWMEKLFTQLKPLLFGNGGPIILVQVENEYGSFGDSKAYMEMVRDIIKKHVGTDALLYTTDGAGPRFWLNGYVPGTLTTIDFGRGTDVKAVTDVFRRFMPQGPIMNSEYYPGWLTHWGEKLATVPTSDVVRTLKQMLDHKYNVNIYMFFGGTNFEFTAGANTPYLVDITSYDYDAPLTEAGDPTDKYFAIRDALITYFPEVANLPAPISSPKGDYGPVRLTSKLSMLSTKGRDTLGKKYKKRSGQTLPTFEDLRQRSGFLLFETTVQENNGLLEITDPRDRIYIFVDGNFQGILSRSEKKHQLPLRCNVGSTLSLLVENQGRINFEYMNDKKGILSPVTLNTKTLNGEWSITGYPLESLPDLDGDNNTYGPPITFTNGPVLYDGKFILPDGNAPLDTFLDTTGWGKGMAWINGHNLGRYWPYLGPQVTLYVPGVWLRPAPEENYLQLLELQGAPDDLTVTFIDYPILNRTKINYNQ